MYDVNRRAMSKRVVYTVLNLHSDKNETKKSAKMDRYLKCEFLPIPNTLFTPGIFLCSTGVLGWIIDKINPKILYEGRLT